MTTKQMWLNRAKWSLISVVAVGGIGLLSGFIVLGSTANDRVQTAVAPYEAPLCLQAFLGKEGRTLEQVMKVKAAQNDTQAKMLMDTYQVAKSIPVGKACGLLIDGTGNNETDVAERIKEARAKQMIAEAKKPK
jgi:hypothetical protein